MYKDLFVYLYIYLRQEQFQKLIAVQRKAA